MLLSPASRACTSSPLVSSGSLGKQGCPLLPGLESCERSLALDAWEGELGGVLLLKVAGGCWSAGTIVGALISAGVAPGGDTERPPGAAQMVLLPLLFAADIVRGERATAGALEGPVPEADSACRLGWVAAAAVVTEGRASPVCGACDA